MKAYETLGKDIIYLETKHGAWPDPNFRKKPLDTVEGFFTFKPIISIKALSFNFILKHRLTPLIVSYTKYLPFGFSMAIARAVDRRLFFLFDRAHTQLSGAADNILARGSGLGRSQAAVLIFLGYNNGCTLTELAAGVGRKNSAISGLIDRMTDADLTERKMSYGDRRTRTVHLTDKGWLRRDEVMNDFRDFNMRLVKGMSESEIETILNFFTVALTNIEPLKPE
ncbi:MAG: MarR family winged helix-turn-helix transcriptional regulator [Litorimonas sp.]